MSGLARFIGWPDLGGSMRRGTNTLDVCPVEQETLEAEEFRRLVKTNPGLISSSTVVPPKLGKSGFGSLLVRYTHPSYKRSWLMAS